MLNYKGIGKRAGPDFRKTISPGLWFLILPVLSLTRKALFYLKFSNYIGSVPSVCRWHLLKRG